MTFEEFRARALAVPFLIGGRDWSGWDCWGLVFCAYRDVPELGGPVKSYAPEYDASVTYLELAAMIAREKAEWHSIEGTPVAGDVGLYRVGRHETHVALVAPGRRMLHCEHSVGTVNEPLSGLVWAGRNVGYFRRNSDYKPVHS